MVLCVVSGEMERI